MPGLRYGGTLLETHAAGSSPRPCRSRSRETSRARRRCSRSGVWRKVSCSAQGRERRVCVPASSHSTRVAAEALAPRVSEIAPPLTYEKTTRVLARLAGAGEFVLVGGQAVNFWAGMYEHVTPELADNGPYTSKDIDFAGSKEVVKECAVRLGGTAG